MKVVAAGLAVVGKQSSISEETKHLGGGVGPL